MDKKRVRIVYSLMVLVCLYFIGINEVKAEENDEALGFTYENILPKNQIGDNSYFELKVKPGYQQTLITKVTNQTDAEKTIKISVSDATTSSTGIINYGPSKEKLLGEDVLLLTDMIEAPNQIKLKAYETKEIEMKLTVPKEEFDGLVLGGVQLKEVTSEDNEESIEGVGLQNKYVYLYSISLKENDTKIEPDIVISEAYFEEIAYLSIDNPKQMIVDNMTIETLLMGEDSDKVLKEFREENYRMAPNSKLTMPLEGTEELASGLYRTKTSVTVDGKKWQFENSFEVTSASKEINQGPVEEETTKEKTVNWLIVMGVLVSFVAVAIGILFLLNKQTNKKR